MLWRGLQVENDLIGVCLARQDHSHNERRLRAWQSRVPPRPRVSGFHPSSYYITPLHHSTYSYTTQRHLIETSYDSKYLGSKKKAQTAKTSSFLYSSSSSSSSSSSPCFVFVHCFFFSKCDIVQSVILYKVWYCAVWELLESKPWTLTQAPF